MAIMTELLSARHLQFRRMYYGAATLYSRKQVCSLLSKTKYVFHSENLKFYLARNERDESLPRDKVFDG